MSDGRFEQLYEQTIIAENNTKKLLIQFAQDYPNVIKESNANTIAESLQKKADKDSILAELRNRQRSDK